MKLQTQFWQPIRWHIQEGEYFHDCFIAHGKRAISFRSDEDGLSMSISKWKHFIFINLFFVKFLIDWEVNV